MAGNDHSVNFNIPCQKQSIAEVLEKISIEIARVDPDITDLDFRLEMAVREMLANAIEHGCETYEQEIEIELEATGSRVKIAVEDPGKGFDCEKVNLNDMPVLEEKGRGLAMINEAADEINFNEAGNRITVYFNKE